MWYWIQCRTVQCVEWSRGRCKVIVIIWAIVKREGNCMAIYFHENCDRIIIPSVYFFPLKNACKVCSFWRSPTKLFQWSIIQTQVGIIKKCWDINCTFLFTDLIKKCKTNTENTVMKYLPGPKHIKTSTITRYKNIQKAISTQFSCPVP